MTVLGYYCCPEHKNQYSAQYLREMGKLPKYYPCQANKCVLERVVTDPTDTFDLGATT